ncbi:MULTISPECIES: ABC transporter permease subunit [unclassified Clostridium]|uniref:ABC transporter permease subunit n=1 Tax=unclassified Clostridium TaxID=2614128 RepID=UPI0025BB7B65|nr:MULTISPECIES: ABC transporter permease subunit [unclassified Clostridium]
MKIKMYELKKAITSPIILSLLAIFIAFNFFIIFNNGYSRDELKVLNKIVDKFGYEINDKMVNEFDNYYNDELNKMNEITSKKTSKSYESVLELFKDNEYSPQGYKGDIYNEEEKKFISELSIVEIYRQSMKNIDERYSTIDTMTIAESAINSVRLSGKAADTLRNEYKKLGDRFEKIKENGEHKNLFFIGEIYRMHSFLFKTLFKNIIFQIMVIVVLITAYLVNYEFENSTHHLAYSSKRGRKIIMDKLFASIISSIIVTTIIMGVTLLAYFIFFDYSGLWNVPISTAFNWEYNLPYISWWNMSFAQYLFFSIGIVYICELLFAGITFVISKFIKNSYVVFFIFAIIFGGSILIPGFMPASSNAIFITGFTPFCLILNPFLWFMGNGVSTVFKYYGIITVCVWSVLLIILCTLCIKKFKRESIY